MARILESFTVWRPKKPALSSTSEEESTIGASSLCSFRIFDGADLVINAAEKLDIKEEISDKESQKTRIIKIVNMNDTYAAISSKYQLYIMSRMQGDIKTKPELTLLDIPSEHPIADIALTIRSLIVLYSPSESKTRASELIEKMAEMEFRKNQDLKKSDYLNSEEGFDLSLKAKKSSMKKSRDSGRKFTFFNVSGGFSKDSEKPKKPPKLRGYQRLYNLAESSRQSLLQKEIRLSSPTVSKLYLSLQEGLQSPGKVKESDLPDEIESPYLGKKTLETMKPPPAVLPSDFDRQQKVSLAQINYSQGGQSRGVWVSLVLEGQEKELMDHTLRHLPRGLAKAASHNHLQHVSREPKGLAPVRQVRVKGLDLESKAKAGLESLEEIRSGLTKEIQSCQSLVALSERVLRHKFKSKTKTDSHVDFVLKNVEKSKEFTADKIKLQREEISRALKTKITQLAIKKQMTKESSLSWKESSQLEVKTTAEIMKRIERTRFLKKARPVLKAVQITLVVHHFMRSVMILLDNYKMMEDEPLSPASPLPKKPAKNLDLHKARLQRDSRFNIGMLAMFQESSKIRQIINRTMSLRLQNLLGKRQEKISKAATILTIFGKRVARRRIIDLCILVANLNCFLVQKYTVKSQSNQISMPETTKVLAKQAKLLSNKHHLTSGFLQKHRAACTEFAADSNDITSDLFNLLDSLLKEFLPFSLHWASLQFDKSYFLLKKTNISEDLINIDTRAKIDAVQEIYSERSQEFTISVKAYRSKIHNIVRQNPHEVARKRTEYMFQHSFDHIDRLSKSLKEVSTPTEVHTDYLPFRSLKWAFIFAESLCKDLIPSMNFEIKPETASKFLESYNKLLKSNYQEFAFESAKSKRVKPQKKTDEETSEDTESDN